MKFILIYFDEFGYVSIQDSLFNGLTLHFLALTSDFKFQKRKKPKTDHTKDQKIKTYLLSTE